MTLKIRLFKNNITPDVNTVAADFTEADFNGYTFKSLTDWGDVFLNADDNAETDSAVLTWTATDGVVPNDVYGWYTTDPAGAVGPCARFNPAPLPVNAANLSLSVHVFFEDGALS